MNMRVIVGLVFGWIGLACPAWAGVSYVHGKVSLQADGEPLMQLLDELGRQAGFKVVVYGKAELPMIRDRFEGYPLRKALQRLLGRSINHSWVWSSPDQLESIVILTPGKGSRVLGQADRAAQDVAPSPAAPQLAVGNDPVLDELERLASLDADQAKPKDFARLLDALQSGNRTRQELALEAIANIGVEPPLNMSVLRSFAQQAADPDLQAQALDVLMLYDDPGPLRSLLQAIASDPNQANAGLAREYLDQLDAEMNPDG